MTGKIEKGSVSYNIQRGGGACQPFLPGAQCSGHGTCDLYTFKCRCNFGWTDLQCNMRHDEFYIMLGCVLGGVVILGLALSIYCCKKESNGQRRQMNFFTLRMLQGNQNRRPPRQPGPRYYHGQRY
jgi:hypothetical protein